MVADFKLSLSPNSGGDILETSSTDIIELQVQSERNVSLLCSSGLSDKLSSLHIPATFSFYPKHDTDNHSVSVPCDSDDSVSINNDRWIITRQQLPPHDCLLTIVHFDRHDVGIYRCAGVLSRSDSPGLQVEDLSNKLYLKLLHSAGSPSQLGLWATVFFGVIVTSIIAIFLAFVAVVVYSAYRRHRRPPVYQGRPTCLHDNIYNTDYNNTMLLQFTHQYSLDSMEAHQLSTMTYHIHVSYMKIQSRIPHIQDLQISFIDTPIPNGISNVEAQLLVSYSCELHHA